MKTARIFIASSEELASERTYLGSLSGKLQSIFEENGIVLELLEWEDFDSAYNGIRKQDEYNEVIKSSDMFIAMFWTKAGMFTVEEYAVALNSYTKKGNPEIFVLLKDTDANNRTKELSSFIESTLVKDGLTYEVFSNIDTLQFLFVKHLLDKFPVSQRMKEVDGKIKLGTIKIAEASICVK